MEDYKSELHKKINALQSATKKGEIQRELRLVMIEQLTEEYFAKTGELPDAKALQRLEDLCIYEELTDSRPDKMTLEEYPIMSDYQLARRQHGMHRKKAKEDDLPVRMEVPLSWAANYGADGKNYSYPYRRERDDYENEWVNEMSRSRNEERNRKYKDFVVGKVVRGEDGRFKRQYSDGVFTVNVATGEKITHKEDY
jgi:hypothetical protein